MTPTSRTIVSLSGLPTNPVAISTYRLAELLAIEQEIAELREDKARLDWLLCEGTREIITPTTRAKKIVLAYVKDEAESYRAAIDAAMEATK